jgi:hypothetical protein
MGFIRFTYQLTIVNRYNIKLLIRPAKLDYFAADFHQALLIGAKTNVVYFELIQFEQVNGYIYIITSIKY